MITPDLATRHAPASARRVRRRLARPMALAFAALGLLVVGGCITEPPIEPAVTSVEILGGNRTLEVDDTAQLTATVSAVGGASEAVVWTSGDDDVASVDATGLVTAIAAGSTTISATSDFDRSVSDRIVVTVVEPVTPTPLGFDCDEIDEGAAGPTLLCVSEGGEVTVRIPWQGQDLRVSSLALDGLWRLPPEEDFEPLSDWPLLRLAVTTAVGGESVVDFDPPLALSVRYGAEDFAAATPAVDEGELGLGVWDAEGERWIVVGHGVFHEGFWLADPIAGDGIDLIPDRVNAQPRFQLTGSPEEGQAISLVAATLPSLPLAWGAMPPDPEHMLKEFDGPCVEVELDVGPAVECVSTMVGLTVRVPVQGDGTVTPRVIALPWNKASTFDVDDGVGTRDEHDGPLIRRLMNFLVVDADTGELLTEFAPPLEFEIEYAPEDKDPELNPFLGITYWNEYVEQFVLLGGGDTSACTSTFDGSTFGSCPWGFPEAAGPTNDERFDGLFFLTDPVDPDGLGGIAKFTYDQWGDRMVAMMR